MNFIKFLLQTIGVVAITIYYSIVVMAKMVGRRNKSVYLKCPGTGPKVY